MATEAKQLRTIATLKGHVGAVWCLAFSQCGRYLASGGQDRALRLWDIQVMKSIASRLNAHTGNIRAVAFSRDNQSLLSGSDDKMVKVWKVPSFSRAGRQLGPHGNVFFGGVHHLALSPTAPHVLAVAGGRHLTVWNLHSGTRLARVRHTSGWLTNCKNVCFDLTGEYCLSSSRGEVRQWRSGDWTDAGVVTEFSGDFNGVKLASHPTASQVAIFGRKGVMVWDIRKKTRVFHAEIEQLSAWKVRFSPNGQLLALVGSGGLCFLNTITWSVTRVGEGLTATAVAFHPNGKYFAAATCQGMITLHSIGELFPSQSS